MCMLGAYHLGVYHSLLIACCVAADVAPDDAIAVAADVVSF